jgi:hypothetical protein
VFKTVSEAGNLEQELRATGAFIARFFGCSLDQEAQLRWQELLAEI